MLKMIFIITSKISKIQPHLVDMMGYTHWSKNMYIEDEKFQIDGLEFLKTGTYYIICTNEDGNSVHTSFMKK